MGLDRPYFAKVEVEDELGLNEARERESERRRRRRVVDWDLNERVEREGEEGLIDLLQKVCVFKSAV